MTKKIQQRSMDTQDRILAVTRDLFDDLGQDNVTTDMIATKANVAKGTIFAHFTDRANLTAAVGVEELDRIVDAIRTTQSDEPALEQIMAAYQILLTFFAEKPEFADLFVHQSFYSKGKWSALFTQKCLEFEAILEKIVEHSDPTVDPKFLVGGAQAFFLQIATYHLAEWLEYDEALGKLRSYLTRWLA